MKKEIPQVVKDGTLDEAEKLIFPNPAKTIGGKVARALFKIVKILVSGTKIDV